MKNTAEFSIVENCLGSPKFEMACPKSVDPVFLEM